MNTRKTLLPVIAAALLGGQALAQSDPQEPRREIEAREAAAAQQMREAEQRLAEAAQRIAELSAERLGALGEAQRWRFEFSDRPRLGVNIENDGLNEPVEGVRIVSVTPGSAANEAGLRAGDMITAVNGESMSASSSGDANMRLLDFMQGVEEGDQLDLEFLRDGKVGKIEIEPRAVPDSSYAWVQRAPGFPVPDVHVGAASEPSFAYSFGGWRNTWGNLELVELSEGLGRYFGTDAGLLVISAPESNAFQLQDGDVIKSIDGRDPTSVNHCMRILTSYQPGEKLVLRIMRDKKRETLEVEVPDDRTSRLLREFNERVRAAPRPAAAPAPAAPPAPRAPAERT